MRRVILWLSNALIAGGLLILVGTGLLYGYSRYEEAQAAREAAEIQPPVRDILPATPEITPRATASAVPTPLATSEAETPGDAFVPWPLRSAITITPVPTPTGVPIYPALRIVAPAIRLDSKVVESHIVNGQWEVPKFAAGHLEGTAQPLQGSNVVLAGHVESISSGNVFANLRRLRPGDEIRLYTQAAVVRYRVDTVETVANDDVQVVAPTPRERLTLITCTGSWLPLQHDYSERTVVIASRAG